jgi:hypothetical protein
MKSSKFILQSFALCLAIVCAFAFKPAKRAEGVANHASYFWYSLNPGGNKNNPADYMQVSLEPTCDPGSKVCAVHAQDDGTGHPLGIPASGAVTVNSFIDQVDKRVTN